MSTSGLRFHRVCLHLGGRPVLRDVTLDCPRRSVTCLIGPNGAGKSTLLALAAGLLRPSAGGIEIAGRPERGGMPGVGYLPQESRFPGPLTVSEVFGFARAARGSDRAACREAMEVSGIEAMAGRPVCELSGGWMRRLGLAVALLGPAPLLLLDEPFVGLDPQTLDRVLGHLDRRRAGGDTIVLASHEFELVDLLPREVAVLDEGRLRGTFPPSPLGSRLLYRRALDLEAPPPAEGTAHAG